MCKGFYSNLRWRQTPRLAASVALAGLGLASLAMSQTPVKHVSPVSEPGVPAVPDAEELDKASLSSDEARAIEEWNWANPQPFVDSAAGPGGVRGAFLLYPLTADPVGAGWTLVNFCVSNCQGSDPAAGPGCNQNDDDTAAVTLPFTFTLFGDAYTAGNISNNGNINFGTCNAAFTSVGFPTGGGVAMVAPFWADVDTGDEGDTDNILGRVWYKFVDGGGGAGNDTLVVTWDNVGYYNEQGDKRNTFQVAISDGTNTLMGIGNNVCFTYNDMQWTTGSASGGVGGFGGTPATVGVNRGTLGQYAQVGRFDHAGVDYDGEGGNNDGVSYLDNQRFCFNASGTNICPIPQNFPAGNTFNLTVPAVLNQTLQFSSPEVLETTTVTVTDVNGAQAAGLVITNTPGNPATVNLAWTVDCADAGSYVLNFTVSDNGTPPCTIPATVTINVTCPNQPPTCDAGGPYTASCNGATTDIQLTNGSSDPDLNPLNYVWSSNCPGATFIPNNTVAAPILRVNASDTCNLNCTVTLQVSDGIAPPVSCDASVTITDTAAPALVGKPGDVTVDCDDVPSPPNVTATDDCDTNVAVAYDEQRTDGDCPHNYTLTRTWTATDGCSNTTIGVQTITVEDNTAPSINTPAADDTVECDGNDAAAFAAWLASNGGASASDACGAVTWSHNSVGLSDDCGGTGSETVTFTATDECGNSSSTTATFTVEDNTDPTIDTAAADETVECDGGSVAAFTAWLANNGGASASDACGAVTWTNNSASLSDGCGATGSETVTFTATDECGNSSSTTATFTIADTTDPSIDTEASDLTVECGPNNAAELAAWLASNGGAVASDDCSGISWFNDYAALSDDCGATGSAVVNFDAKDACGNGSITTATFTIVDTTAPSIDTLAADETVECDADSATAFATWIANNGGASASDICGSVTWSHNSTGLSDGCGGTGSETVTFTATDECGNTADTIATFSVVDTIPPALTIPADIGPVNADPGICGKVLDPGTASATDDCATPTITGVRSDAQPLNAVYPVGITTITWTADDGCNETVDTQTIEVVSQPRLTIEEVDHDQFLCIGDTVVVEVWMRDVCGPELASSFQAFIDYNTAKMSLSSVSYTTTPFGLIAIPVGSGAGTTHPSPGNIQLSSGIQQFPVPQPPVGGPGNSDHKLATLTFIVVDPLPSNTVTFDLSSPIPSRIAMYDPPNLGTPLPNQILVNSGEIGETGNFADFIVDVELLNVNNGVPMQRCITFQFYNLGLPVGGPLSYTMIFTNGLASGSLKIPCATNYDCVTATDELHTLRRTTTVTAVGDEWHADFTGPDGLLSGNLDNNAFIDVLDFATFINTFGSSPGANTPCGTLAPHADLTGDGIVFTGDFTFIFDNYLQFRELDCGGNLLEAPPAGTPDGLLGVITAMPRPTESISIAELNSLGLGHLAIADLNHDGVVDFADMEAFAAGVRPGDSPQLPHPGQGRARD